MGTYFLPFFPPFFLAAFFFFGMATHLLSGPERIAPSRNVIPPRGEREPERGPGNALDGAREPVSGMSAGLPPIVAASRIDDDHDRGRGSKGFFVASIALLIGGCQ